LDARTILTVQGFVEQTENFDDEMHLNEETMIAQASVEAISEAARAFASTEGRKMILLVTGNLPLASVSPTAMVGRNMNGNHLTDVTRNNSALSTMRDVLVREANASNASFYIISRKDWKCRTRGRSTRAIGTGPPLARPRSIARPCSGWPTKPAAPFHARQSFR